MLAEAMSSDKYDLISKLQQEGHTVAMTGDGINDGPALAAADLGVSVGSATDIAMEAADVVLMRNDLRDIITALHLSKAVFRRIQYNFVWALGYNVLSIPIAAGVIYPVVRTKLPPELAAFTMAFSSISVILSSLLLKLYRKPVILVDQAHNTVHEQGDQQPKPQQHYGLARCSLYSAETHV